MSRLALGTAQFGLDYGIANKSGMVPIEVVGSMLEFARSNGIEVIDTAIAYGSSEKSLGHFYLGPFNTVTKLPKIDSGVSDIYFYLSGMVNSSLTMLGLEQIYGLLLHNPMDLLSLRGKDIYRSLVTFKEEGKVKKIGVSVYEPSELDLLCSKYEFDLVQAPFNIVDRRLSESGWLARLKDADIEVHIRSAFLQGLLLMNRSSIPFKFKKWDSIWTTWNQWLSENNITALTACLGYPLSFTEVDRVVVGADNLLHLKEIVEASKLSFPDKIPEIVSYDQDLINPSRWTLL